jgi:hypothetical protein
MIFLIYNGLRNGNMLMDVLPQPTEESFEDFHTSFFFCIWCSNNVDEDRRHVELAQNTCVKIVSEFTEDTKKYISGPGKGFKQRNLAISHENC